MSSFNQQKVPTKYNGGKWSQLDEIRLFKMTMLGYSDLHIANRLGRTKQAIAHRRHCLRSYGQWAKWLKRDPHWWLCEDVAGDYDTDE